MSTPAGPFTIVAGDDGAVLASGWTENEAELVEGIAPRLRPRSLRRRADLGAITASVEGYLGGAVPALDEVPVEQEGGAFLERAWQLLRAIPPGHPITYAVLAERCGLAGADAARAAGGVCASNSAALFVPCHRVVGADGSLRGFRWGLEVKQWLLDHEAGIVALPLG
jgi:methylated-DNA-[protein]-cysteine S-methyltransferase